MRFRDRVDAGAHVAAALSLYGRRSDVVVAALHPSALPIAVEVARRLDVPLVVLPAVPFDVPDYPGLVLGALAPGGIEVVDRRLISALDIPDAAVRQAAARAHMGLDRGALSFAPADIPARAHTVVIVEDGLIVSTVVEAAALAFRQKGAARVIVAAPVGRKDVCARAAIVADEVVCLVTPDPFGSIRDAFEVFPDVSPDDVRRLAAGGRAAGPADPANVVRRRALSLAGERSDYDALLDGIGDARIVLLGEATHGTHEFYRERAIITRRLIDEKHFAAVAVEADWPDAYRVNRYVRGAGPDEEAADALGGFRRFPQWMWRNADVLDFVGWLRAHNDSLPGERRTGFYGLDLYSLRESIEAVLGYLQKVDPEAAERARRRYGCFDRFDGEMQEYTYAMCLGLTPSCERDVIAQLVDLHRRRAEYASRDGRIAPDDYFFAEQNARLIRNAEEYYRGMLGGRAESWNLRDRHMAGTLRDLVGFLEHGRADTRVVVWAHNSHIGDARATEMGEQGELTLGQLARDAYGPAAVLVGFTTSTGTVTAASDWDGPAHRKEVRPPLPGSYEQLFQETGITRFLLPIRAEPELATVLSKPRLERAIGVLYLPRSERASHYFHADIASQFDYVLHFDRTRAVEPLERTAEWEAGELAETWPSGL